MANHKSALKRARQSEDRRLRNRSVKTRVKKVVKQLRLTAAQGTGDALSQEFVTAQTAIDKAAKKGVIHKRAASRKISRLARLVNKTAVAAS